MTTKTPCDQCPWRTANQGKKHEAGFYTIRNLRRLWNQVRRGGAQSCHLTDPSHPDHIIAGASPNAKPQECPGSVILIRREIDYMASLGKKKNTVGDEEVNAYLADRSRKGLTKSGVLYWVMTRVQLGGVPYIGGRVLPDVNVDDPEIGLPDKVLRGTS